MEIMVITNDIGDHGTFENFEHCVGFFHVTLC